MIHIVVCPCVTIRWGCELLRACLQVHPIFRTPQSSLRRQIASITLAGTRHMDGKRYQAVQHHQRVTSPGSVHFLVPDVPLAGWVCLARRPAFQMDGMCQRFILREPALEDILHSLFSVLAINSGSILETVGTAALGRATYPKQVFKGHAARLAAMFARLAGSICKTHLG